MGADIVGSTPAEFSAHIKAELEKYAKVIKAAAIPRIE
jgi:tripartite-type tricarboxylate transporter receptor subunit TctC